MSTKTVKYSTVAVATAMAIAALVAAAAPAFAWGAEGGPDSAYDVYGYGSGYYNYAPGYYDYAPGALANQASRPAAHHHRTGAAR